MQVQGLPELLTVWEYREYFLPGPASAGLRSNQTKGLVMYMKHEEMEKAAAYTKAHKRKRNWHKVVTVLAAVVVFCTTYSLILPAITMEKNGCGKTEHRHTEACYAQSISVSRSVLICPPENLGIHEHTSACLDEKGDYNCGYSDFVLHSHDASCFDAEGELWCPLPEIKAHTHDGSCYAAAEPAHTHTENCYIQERGELVCTEEAADHQHRSDCYAWEQVLNCDLTETVEEPALVCGKPEILLHEHSSGCFDGNGALSCGRQQVLEHVHGQDCFQTVEEAVEAEVLICGMEEHTHTSLCKKQSNAGETVSAKADTAVVEEAVVWLTGEDTFSPDGRQRMAFVSAITRDTAPGDIASHLDNAQIEINGEPYDGSSALNPGEQFTVALHWQLTRENLNETLTYTYKLPEQINVKDVAETILYDENNNRKGVYSIINGVLTVTYDNVADLNTTSFKLNATWNQEKISQETTVSWNDSLKTTVHFDNSRIAATKELLDYKTIEDGSLVAEYAVNVAASGSVENVTLTDTLTSEKFHFCRGYYEVAGEKYDYRYRIVNADGAEEYRYANFPEGTFDADGKQLTDTITFPEFKLDEGQTCTVEYAVQLDAADRFELDQYQSATGLTNTATASYPYGDDTIESSVTVTDTYRAEKKWILKEQGKLSEDDVQQDTDVPWKVIVNPAREYDMGGAVIGDSIQTDGVVYETKKPITITSTTDAGSTSIVPQWITLDDQIVKDIQSAGGQAADLLFSQGYESYLSAIHAAVGHSVSREELSNYVFVGKSKQQFVWFSPQEGTPTTYELSYITDTSNAASGTLVNSANAGWKSWTVGVVTGSFYQEVTIEKENAGVYQRGDDYFVDWTVTLQVPTGSNAIPDVFLYDVLPYHSESDGYDQLVGLSASEFDYAGLTDDQMKYLNTISRPAFTISTTSEDSDVQAVVKAAATSLGHPVTGLGDEDYRLYEGNDTLRGQLPIINGGDIYSNHRITPTRFGVWLGDLPATTGKDGYTITVQYTTRADPKLVEGLNGRAYGNNTIGLMQRQNNSDILLGKADSSYWLDHANVQNALAKSVAAYDPEHSIVTYQVNINPDVSMKAESAGYILRDVLDLPGAAFIENSFQLSFQGTVSNDAKFHWDNSVETVLWRSDNSDVDLYPNLSDGMKGLTQLNVENSESGSSRFTFTLDNLSNIFALTSPEEYAGQFAPMVLTYQVQLPAGAEKPKQETITNSVTLSMNPPGNSEVLLDGVKAEFDYTSALHKWLNAVPNGNNGYTASFVISVDKTAEEWKNAGDSFTVSDEMSKSLVVDVTSVKVYGIKGDGSEERLQPGRQYTPSYNDQSESQNYLYVAITDSDEYVKYRIEYDAKVQGEAGQTVSYDNVARVEGANISSEEVEKQVYIQKQDGSVTETNYEVKLLKFDAGDIFNKLQATFTLYAWDGGQWTQKWADLTTNENGELTLNNTLYDGLGLGPKTWYKLVETNAPDGYLKGVTYFHIGKMGENESKPEEIGSYTTIPLTGGTHQIPNYKASVRLHKTDGETGSSSYLTGAVFGLYGNQECSGEPLAVSKEERTGIYSFELTGLTAGQTYYLREIKAPKGYQLSDTVYTLYFDQEGKVTLKNGDETVPTDSVGAYLIANRSSHELPMTGGTGTTMYTIGGLLLLAGAGILLVYSNKKRGKEDFASS